MKTQTQDGLPWPVRALRWIASWMIVAAVVAFILLMVAVLQCAGWAVEVFAAAAIPVVAFGVRLWYGKR